MAWPTASLCEAPAWLKNYRSFHRGPRSTLLAVTAHILPLIDIPEEMQTFILEWVKEMKLGNEG